MNWEAIGAVGEVAGALLVGVTLIYLAVQLRQNTRQVEEHSRAQRFTGLGILTAQWGAFRRSIIGESSTASVWRRGNEDPSQLSPDEWTQFDLLMVEFFWGIANNFVFAADKGLVDYVADDIADNLVTYDSPGLRAWWSSTPHKREYPKAVVEHVDRLLSQPPADPPSPL